MNEASTPRRQIISVAVRPKSHDDWDKLQGALTALIQEDQSMRTESQATEQRVIIHGMGELHLQIICERLVHEFNVPLDLEKPKVTYLENIRQPSEAEAKYIRRVGGRSQYAHVKLNLGPAEPDSRYQFANESPDGALPHRFVEAIDSGVQEALKAGVLAGHEIVDVRVALRDGSYHVTDSSDMAFKIAASTALKEAARKAKPVVLEPLMSIKVFTQGHMADLIVEDLTSRRGRIERIDSTGTSAVIHAVAPLAELLGYHSHLLAMTKRSSSDIQFARYERVTDKGDSGADEIGVPAGNPTRPRPRNGLGVAKPNEQFD